jgi:hypothetical protein
MIKSTAKGFSSGPASQYYIFSGSDEGPLLGNGDRTSSKDGLIYGGKGFYDGEIRIGGQDP